MYIRYFPFVSLTKRYGPYRIAYKDGEIVRLLPIEEPIKDWKEACRVADALTAARYCVN